MNPAPRTKMAPVTFAARCASTVGQLFSVPPGMFRSPALLLTLSLLASSLQAAPSYPLVGLAVPDTRTDKTDLVPLTVDEVHKLRMVYGSDQNQLTTKPVQLVRDVTGRLPGTRVIPYMGGYTTNLAPEAQKAQRTHIEGVAMIKVGKLTQEINATIGEGTTPTDNFTILMDTKDSTVLIPRKTNTAVDVDFPHNPVTSGPDPYSITFDVASQYDSWLRVGDEWMQIKSVTYTHTSTQSTAKVTVTRGYQGTGAASHANNANVFSPVYLGDNAETDDRLSQSYPDNSNSDQKVKGTLIRYALDPGSPVAVDFRIDVINGYTDTTTPVAPATKRSYDGAWWDTFNQVFTNLCDARGNPVRPSVPPTPPSQVRPVLWNFATGAEYTDAEFVAKLKSFTRAVRLGINDGPEGLPPVLYANTTFKASPTYHTGNDNTGTESLADRPIDANGDPLTWDDGLLDAACFEDSFLTPDGDVFKRIVDGDGVKPDLSTPDPNDTIPRTDWTDILTKMIDAARESRPFICMIGPAGDKAGEFNIEHDPAGYENKLRFSYASYLMAVELHARTTPVPDELPPDCTLSFGLPLLVSGVPGAPFIYRLSDMFFEQIGAPVTPNSLTQNYPSGLKVGSTGAYARKFATGFVAVYPVFSGTNATITLPTKPTGKHWYRADTGIMVQDSTSTLTLSPGGSLVLVLK